MDLSLVPRTGQPVFRTSGRGNRGGRATCRRAGEDLVPVVSAVPGGRPRLPPGQTWDLGGFLGSGMVPPDPAARGRPDRGRRWTPAIAGANNVGLLAGAKPASRRARAAIVKPPGQHGPPIGASIEARSGRWSLRAKSRHLLERETQGGEGAGSSSGWTGGAETGERGVAASGDRGVSALGPPKGRIWSL